MVGGETGPHVARVVLAVDDEADVLVAYRRLFRERLPGVRLLTAASGEEGLEHLRMGRVDLALVDYRLPGMDGLQFLIEAQKLQPGLHSMVLTAYPDPQLARRATKEGGASIVIAKPFEIEMLGGAVSFFLAQIRAGERAAA